MTPANPRASTLAYQRTAALGGVAAADPHRLVLMLMDGALERIAQARGCLQHGALADKSALLSAAVSIVEELRASLDLEAGGAIAANLDDLYDYIARRLLLANLGNRAELLDEAASLLGEIRSAWAALPAQLAAQPGG